MFYRDTLKGIHPTILHGYGGTIEPTVPGSWYKDGFVKERYTPKLPWQLEHWWNWGTSFQRSQTHVSWWLILTDRYSLRGLTRGRFRLSVLSFLRRRMGTVKIEAAKMDQKLHGRSNRRGCALVRETVSGKCYKNASEGWQPFLFFCCRSGDGMWPKINLALSSCASRILLESIT